MSVTVARQVHAAQHTVNFLFDSGKVNSLDSANLLRACGNGLDGLSDSSSLASIEGSGEVCALLGVLDRGSVELLQ